jgi:hypothetical protein
MEYRVQQRATIWVETNVEADTIDDALEKAQEQMTNGDYRELYDTFELAGEWWAEDSKGNESELPKDWR